MNTGACSVIILLLFASSAGCLSTLFVQPAPTPTLEPAATATPKSVVSAIAPSEMALQLADVPGDYILKERADIPYTKTAQIARDLGWRQGYSVSFYRTNPGKYDMTGLRQTIELYPVANMNRVFDIAKETMSLSVPAGQGSITELPMERIGDKSVAYITEQTGAPYSLPVYTILFVKKDVFEKIEMSGTTTDFETLKNLARVAAEKIQ